VYVFHEGKKAMLRRSLMAGGLVTATGSSLTRVARARSGKPMLVFMGHEL